MDIIPDISQGSFVSSIEIEQVQKQKQEYFLLGTFLRTKGLNLFYYNPANGEIKEATIKYSDTIHVYRLPDRWITVDWEYQRCTIEGKYIYFEALNLDSATKRVRRYKEGIIKQLANLRVPSKEGINFY